MGPVRDSIQKKITESLNPKTLVIHDDSSKHAGHAAMRGQDATETHFRLEIVSDAFQGKTLIQRHRMIYTLLDDELKHMGLHALQIKAKTLSEEV